MTDWAGQMGRETTIAQYRLATTPTIFENPFLIAQLLQQSTKN
jgi:hypothetical protein